MATDTDPALAGSSIYQIFTRNFTSEGTFDAAARRLPDVAGMGFDIVYLTPFHPIGRANRKGTEGSPYAISDYRAVDASLGGEPGLRRFLDRARELGLRVIMDVVFNHASPDSVLAREHPDWFVPGPDGKPGRRVAEWTDVVDLDFSKAGLREYLFETLERWRRFGLDGFRCDVASLVPVDFWIEARRRAAAVETGRPAPVWLAESVHKEFVRELRRAGHYAACDPELHAAFDLSYDYDGREELERAWSGAGGVAPYLRHLAVQETLYPAGSIKARFLENHDQARIASRFRDRAVLKAWTAFAMLLPGAFFAYMGQESAQERKPDLFERDPMDEPGDDAFKGWYAGFHRASKRVREAAPVTDVSEPADGVVALRRRGPGADFLGLVDLRATGRTRAFLGAVRGRNLLTGEPVELGPDAAVPAEPLLLDLKT